MCAPSDICIPARQPGGHTSPSSAPDGNRGFTWAQVGHFFHSNYKFFLVHWYFDFKTNNVKDAILHGYLVQKEAQGHRKLLGILFKSQAKTRGTNMSVELKPATQVTTFLLLHFISLRSYVHLGAEYMCAKVCERKSVDNFWGSVLSLFPVGSWGGQAWRRCLYLSATLTALR